MKKKSLIMLVCALMIVGSVAFGTIAYLTDRAGVKNNFTIGNVDIAVDETLVDETGNPVVNPEYNPQDPASPPHLRTDDENVYPLIPGSEYVKDPTLTVKAGSEESYVRMVVTISNAAELKEIFAELQAMYPGSFVNGFDPEEHVTGWDNTVWPLYDTKENTAANSITLEFRHPTAVKPSATEDTVLPALFATLKVPGQLNNSHLQKLQNLSISVYGHAIQSTGFDSADAAWAAFDAQMNAENGINP